MTMTVRRVTLRRGAEAAGSDELKRPEGKLERLALVIPALRRLDHEFHRQHPTAFGDEHGPVLDQRRRDGAGIGGAAGVSPPPGRPAAAVRPAAAGDRGSRRRSARRRRRAEGLSPCLLYT